MDRVYNFSPGPSMMPLPALETAAKELCSYGTTGVSVMEMSHRSKMYTEIFDETAALVRQLMAVPENYEPDGQRGQGRLHRQRQLCPWRHGGGPQIWPGALRGQQPGGQLHPCARDQAGRF